MGVLVKRIFILAELVTLSLIVAQLLLDFEMVWPMLNRTRTQTALARSHPQG